MGRRTYIYFIFTILTGAISACGYFLEEDPKSYVEADYLQSPEGFENAVSGLYSYNRVLCEQMLYTGPAGTDIWTMAIGQRTWRDMAWYIDGRMKSSLQNHGFWRILNIAIDRSLYLLENKDDIEMPESIGNRMEGEIRSLIAFWRFLLVETYGSGAHFAVHTGYEINTNGNQQPVAVFYRDILNQIDFAIANLPNPEELPFGRINVAVAKALKAKFLLGLAGYDDQTILAARESLTKEKCIEEAKLLALNVINHHNYKLMPQYADLWDINHEINEEIIWSVQFIRDNLHNGDGNDLHFFWVSDMRIDVATGAMNVPNSHNHSLFYGKKQSYIMPTLFYLQSFGRYDKRLYDSFINTWIRLKNDDPMGFPVEPKHPEDTIIYRSFFPLSEEEFLQFRSRGVIANGLNHIYNLETGIPTENGRKGYHTFTKHLDPTRETPDERKGYKDFIFIRLAEMYLIAAECEVRQENPQKSIPWLKAIRQRVTIEGHENELLEIKASDIDLDFIIDEYGRELGGELWRWYLLKRTGTLIDRVKRYNPDLKDMIKAHHIVRPVPQAEIDLIGNPGEFIQNPGY